jgi:hypothetical protein
MLLYFGTNNIDITDTTLNKIEIRLGKVVNMINPYKTFLIFCNNPKYYNEPEYKTGTNYLEFSCENLPNIFPDEINNYEYVKLVNYNSG